MSNRPKRKAVNDGRDLYAFDLMRGSNQPNVEKAKDDYKSKHVERIFTSCLKGTYFTHVTGNTFDPYNFVALDKNRKALPAKDRILGVTYFKGWTMADQLLEDNPGVDPADWDLSSTLKVLERAASAINAVDAEPPSSPVDAGRTANLAITIETTPCATSSSATSVYPAASTHTRPLPQPSSSSSSPSSSSAPSPEILVAGCTAPPLNRPILKRLEALELLCDGSIESGGVIPRLTILEEALGASHDGTLKDRISALEETLGA